MPTANKVTTGEGMPANTVPSLQVAGGCAENQRETGQITGWSRTGLSEEETAGNPEMVKCRVWDTGLSIML